MAPGGMEQLVVALCADAVGRGDEVVVASGPGAWAGRIEMAGGAHRALPLTSRASTARAVAAVARLAKCVRQFRPQIVHAHNVRAAVMARLALATIRDRAALMTTLHGVPPADYPVAGRILRSATPRVIACAPAVARSLCASGFPSARIDLIVNGAALSPASPERQERMRRRLRVADEPVVVGIGRLTEQKDWPVLIAAARHVQGARFVVAGDGPLRHELESLGRRSGDRVRFAGPIDDIAALVGIASCVVSSSAWEGLPLAVLEALSLGAPTVATAVDGVTDLVSPESAVLVPARDPVALGAAITRILTDGRWAESLHRNALAASDAWHPDHMLRGYRRAYQQAVSPPARSARPREATVRDKGHSVSGRVLPRSSAAASRWTLAYPRRSSGVGPLNKK
jgi:glycosyltransferase involved in cell wall biosynthesis